MDRRSLLLGAPLLAFAPRSCTDAAFEFEQLMRRVSEGWNRQDTELALSAFTADAVYMEPPDVKLYQRHTQLRPYFAALRKGTSVIWHNLFFNEAAQSGTGECSFGEQSDKQVDHGVAMVELRGGKIAVWREYQRKDPKSFDDFLRRDDKTWKWTIKTYP